MPRELPVHFLWVVRASSSAGHNSHFSFFKLKTTAASPQHSLYDKDCQIYRQTMGLRVQHNLRNNAKKTIIKQKTWICRSKARRCFFFLMIKLCQCENISEWYNRDPNIEFLLTNLQWQGDQVGMNFFKAAPVYIYQGLRSRKYNCIILYPAKSIFWDPRQYILCQQELRKWLLWVFLEKYH